MPNDPSIQAPGQNKIFTIVINGRQRNTSQDHLTYGELVKLAFPDDTVVPDSVYTIAYANPHGKDGTVAEGQDVKIKDGMVFNVGKTSRS